LEAKGAAIATVISRCVELAIVILIAHSKRGKFPFLAGVYSIRKIPLNIVKPIIRQGLPLAMNEFLWSFSVTTVLWAFSMRGMAVVAAITIANVLEALFNVSMMALSVAVGTIVGQRLGAGKVQEAKESAMFLTFVCTAFCLCVSFLFAAIAPIFPKLYNTTDAIRSMASVFILIIAVKMPFNSFTSFAYFVIRSGGKSFLTFLFDSVYEWLVAVPLAIVLAALTDLGVTMLVFISLVAPFVVKSIIGYVLIRAGGWANDLTGAGSFAHTLPGNSP